MIFVIRVKRSQTLWFVMHIVWVVTYTAVYTCKLHQWLLKISLCACYADLYFLWGPHLSIYTLFINGVKCAILHNDVLKNFHAIALFESVEGSQTLWFVDLYFVSLVVNWMKFAILHHDVHVIWDDICWVTIEVKVISCNNIIWICCTFHNDKRTGWDRSLISHLQASIGWICCIFSMV